MSSSNIRFRNQSPPTSQARSRERGERTDRDNLKEMNHTLDHSTDMSGTDLDTYDDSRMQEEMLGYPALNLDDLDYSESDQQKNVHSTSLSRHHRSNSTQALDRLSTKISYTKENIKREQSARDGNNFKIR